MILTTNIFACSNWRCLLGKDFAMTDFVEVVRLARAMVREMANGFARALRWLMQLGYPVGLTAAILARR